MTRKKPSSASKPDSPAVRAKVTSGELVVGESVELVEATVRRLRIVPTEAIREVARDIEHARDRVLCSGKTSL
jgi:hypothetical protein